MGNSGGKCGRKKRLGGESKVAAVEDALSNPIGQNIFRLIRMQIPVVFWGFPDVVLFATSEQLATHLH
jgi:hypothetical protein